ncbi:uncharacterized protein G2W53_002867 [Senna tora]|uniref:Uncharacterized protein n=1 Tax=Senna tora TaxID=362788 RepID=A0A835CFT4_9FABA|nr:uncharacterized protein G2W53_002867 [Senna tora]
MDGEGEVLDLLGPTDPSQRYRRERDS